MRIWDRIEPARLCRAHLLGEHRELHGLFNIVTRGREGYSRHPETLRWRGHVGALLARHEALVAECRRRGWPSGSDHRTLLAREEVFPGERWTCPAPLDDQEAVLAEKECECRTGRETDE